MGPCSARNLRMARACSGPMPGSSRSSAGLARLTLTRFGMGASFRVVPARHQVVTATPAGSAREVVDQETRDAVARGQDGEARARAPARVLQLCGVHHYLAARVGVDLASPHS